MTTTTSGKPKVYDVAKALNIGVMLIPPVQLLDLAPVDLLYMISKEYLQSIPLLPEFVKKTGMSEVNIYYIAEGSSINAAATSTPPSSDARSAPLTAGVNIKLTADFKTPAVAPGKLDILLIPGPDPSYTPTDAQSTFICSHFDSGVTDIITICTGIYAAGYAGILDGRSATAPRGLLPELKSKFTKQTRWVSRRWEVDTIRSAVSSKGDSTSNDVRPSELWTSAEISNGHDAVAAYLKAHVPRDLADMVCEMADVGHRGQEHGNGAVKENAWWIWFMLKSWMKSIRSADKHQNLTE